MKYIISIIIFIFSINASAENIGNTQGLLSVPGIAQAVADSAKSMKAVGFVDLDGNIGGGSMLPIRQLHDSSGVNYFAVGPGGLIKQSEHFRPRMVAVFDLSAIFRRIEGMSPWYQAHVSKITLPDFWIGPNVLTPFPGDKFQWNQWKQYLGFSVSVGL